MSNRVGLFVYFPHPRLSLANMHKGLLHWAYISATSKHKQNKGLHKTPSEDTWRPIFFLGKRKQFRYFICTMPQIHFDFEKILHNRKSTVSLMAEFTKTLKMWRGLRIASGSKCRIKILHEYGTFMYQSIFCSSSADICIEFFCYEYLWDLKLSLVYMHNAGLMSRQTTKQRGNSLFKPPIY